MKFLSALTAVATVGLPTGLILCLPLSARAQLTFFDAAGANAAAITPTVDTFRNALGTLNANTPGSVGSGRRQIDWDAVPDSFSDPNSLPGDFFNQNFSPRARGVVFNTPGTGFLVSADSVNPDNASTRFGFPADFIPFSNERLFSPTGSVITNVLFFVPGSNTAATVTGFGAVFNDVEVANVTKIDYFDINNNLLTTRFAQTAVSGGMSFVGVQTSGTPFARVQITSGNIPLLSNGSLGAGGTDGVVMDDFIYAEPIAAAVAAPEPGTLALLGIAALLPLGGIVSRRRRNR